MPTFHRVFHRTSLLTTLSALCLVTAASGCTEDPDDEVVFQSGAPLAALPDDLDVELLSPGRAQEASLKGNTSSLAGETWSLRGDFIPGGIIKSSLVLPPLEPGFARRFGRPTVQICRAATTDCALLSGLTLHGTYGPDGFPTSVWGVDIAVPRQLPVGPYDLTMVLPYELTYLGQFRGTLAFAFGARIAIEAAPPPDPLRIVVGAAVSAASYQPADTLAIGSIVAVFGERLAADSASAPSLPLPTSLSDVRVDLVSGAGNGPVYALGLFYVSPGQLNVMMPTWEEGLRDGAYQLRVTRGARVMLHPVNMVRVQPGLFTVNAAASGAPAGYLLRRDAAGVDRNEPIARFDPVLSRWVPAPITPAAAGEVRYLVLFGTGMRYRNPDQADNLRLYYSATDFLRPAYVGRQGELAGLDQVNVELPDALSGRGQLKLALSVEGKPTNEVEIVMQ